MEIENQKRDLILSQHCVTLTFKLTFESALLIKMMLLLSPMVATFLIYFFFTRITAVNLYSRIVRTVVNSRSH